MSKAVAIANAIERTIGDLTPVEQEQELRRLMVRNASDPAAFAFPAMLPVELAMGIDTPKKVAQAYGYDKASFQALINKPVFIKAFQEAHEMLKVEGASFRTKARMQAEDYLGTAYAMIKSPHTSDAVRADLIKWTARVAGLEAKQVDVANGGNMFAIQINLG